MTLPIFLHRERPLLLFIEEPELFLHPGFQRVFIETALNRSGQEHQIFVTTHSHQFLDITADQHRCSIYQCRKRIGHEQEKTTVKFEVRLSSSDDFSILRELGVRNSSVLLANCTIWVEGITDRQYFRHYLSLYQKHLQEQAQSGKSTPTFLEDLHFSFVEFGGSNITHWSFLDPENGINVKRLCGTAFVICDRDDGEAKTKRNQKLKEILKDRAHILECREVENLLTPEVITGVVRLYEGDDVSLRAFASNDYKSASLGTFIERCVLTDVAGSRRRSSSGHPYADQSGTLKQKTDFCSKAIKAINDFNDLSEEAKVVTKLLHEFIRTQN